MAKALNLWIFLNFLLWCMHCQVWCTRCNQWPNLSPLTDGWWLRWWYCTWYELSALDPNKNSQKLCNNDTATKKGQDGYNPSYKFDYIRWCLIHNINFIKKQDELDIYGDETSWSMASYDEARYGITVWISNKPGTIKGLYTVLVSNVHRIRTRAYWHKHNFHVRPPGWNVWGNIEAKEIMNLVVEGEEGAR